MIRKRLRRDVFLDTLIHEISHAIFEHSGISASIEHNADLEERIIATYVPHLLICLKALGLVK